MPSHTPRWRALRRLRTILSLVLAFATLSACDENAGTGDGGDSAEDSLEQDGTTTTDATETPDGEDDATTTGDTAAEGDADGTADDVEPDVDPPTGELKVERWGGRLPGSIIKLTRIGRELWIGTRPVRMGGIEGEPFRGGLARLDLDTGTLERFDDRLPQVDLDLGDMGAIPTAGALDLGDGRRAFVTPNGFVEFANDTFTQRRILVNGEAVITTQATYDATSQTLWLSSSAGVLAIDPTTFEVEQRIEPAAFTSLDVDGFGSIAVDPDSGSAFVAIYLLEGGTLVARVDTEGRVKTMVVGSDTPAGVVGDIVWSSKAQAAYIALASWNADTGGVITWDGDAVETVVREGELSLASIREEAAFGAWSLELDEDSQTLLVGGRINNGTGTLRGGGLVWIDLARTTDKELYAYGLSWPSTSIEGDHIQSVVFDPQTARTFTASAYPCSDVRLGAASLESISFVGGGPRFSTPALSGVRDFATLDGAITAVLRDDLPGNGCFGSPTQRGIVQLADDHAGWTPEVRPPTNDTSGYFHANRYSTWALDALDDGHVAIAGGREEAFIGSFAGPSTFSHLPIAFGLANGAYDVEWVNDSTLWIAGPATHSNGDADNLEDVGPRGAALITVGDRGPQSHLHFVRATRDAPDSNTVVGLPTSEVRDVVVDAASGDAYLLLASERLNTTYDRLEGALFIDSTGNPRRGGLARVSAKGELTVVVESGDTLPDPRAGALDADGNLHVLDATLGVAMVAPDGTVSTPDPAPYTVPSGSVPLDLWVGDDGDQVAAWSTGAWVQLGDASGFIEDLGYVWTSMPVGDNAVLLGADDGIALVYTGDTAPSPWIAAPAGEAPPYGAIPRTPVTTCGDVDASCADTADCCSGLSCEANDKGVMLCAEPAGCLESGAVCNGGETCCSGLVCGGSGIVPACVPDENSCKKAGELCNGPDDCCAGLGCGGGGIATMCVAL